MAGVIMSVPPNIARPMIFVCVNSRPNDRGEIEKLAVATASFVAIPLAKKTVVIYIVTARHFLDSSREFGNLFIQFKDPNGKPYYMQVEQDSFVQNPDADISVLPLTNDYDALMPRYGAIPTSSFADAIYVRSHGIKLGDEVIFASPFPEFADNGEWEPLIREGRIAMKPTSMVELISSSGSEAKFVPAYIVECESWRSEIGAPVYIHNEADDEFRVLGLVGTHSPMRVRVPGQEGGATEDLPAGHVAVIPAQAILDTLNQKTLRDHRQRVLNSIRGN